MSDIKNPKQACNIQEAMMCHCISWKREIQVLNIALAKQQFKRERNSCRGPMETNPYAYYQIHA
jgi:hypothetical protein